jgi:hypothetical protein
VQQSDQTYIRDRSIEVLKYVRDNSPSPTNFVRNIKQYLSEKMDNFVNNNSIAIHFLKPLIFYGLVDEIIPEKDVYRDVITIDGTQFLMHYENGEYEEATKSFLHCLLRSKYSNNKATSRTKTPGLYPFRIIFYLLRMHGELLIDDFKR